MPSAACLTNNSVQTSRAALQHGCPAVASHCLLPVSVGHTAHKTVLISTMAALGAGRQGSNKEFARLRMGRPPPMNRNQPAPSARSYLTGTGNRGRKRIQSGNQTKGAVDQFVTFA